MACALACTVCKWIHEPEVILILRGFFRYCAKSVLLIIKVASELPLCSYASITSRFLILVLYSPSLLLYLPQMLPGLGWMSGSCCLSDAPTTSLGKRRQGVLPASFSALCWGSQECWNREILASPRREALEGVAVFEPHQRQGKGSWRAELPCRGT